MGRGEREVSTSGDRRTIRGGGGQRVACHGGQGEDS